jgi:hypothetical protein
MLLINSMCFYKTGGINAEFMRSLCRGVCKDLRVLDCEGVADFGVGFVRFFKQLEVSLFCIFEMQMNSIERS